MTPLSDLGFTQAKIECVVFATFDVLAICAFVLTDHVWRVASVWLVLVILVLTFWLTARVRDALDYGRDG